MKEWGNHDGYIYAHDAPHDIARQEYMPEELRGREYYHPKPNGYERELKPRLDTIREILHGGGRPQDPGHAGEQDNSSNSNK